jgi:hypothetical protein
MLQCTPSSTTIIIKKLKRSLVDRKLLYKKYVKERGEKEMLQEVLLAEGEVQSFKCLRRNYDHSKWVTGNMPKNPVFLMFLED